MLQSRNKALGAMLEDAIITLRSNRKSSSNDPQSEGPIDDENLNISLARLQFIAVYLADSDISIPPDIAEPQGPAPDEEHIMHAEQSAASTDPDHVQSTTTDPPYADPDKVLQPAEATVANHPPPPPKRPVRPTLADATFSFMLGPGRHRSSFVSSVADLPQETRRGSDASSKQKPKAIKSKGDRDRGKDKDKGSKGHEVKRREDDEGFTLHPLHGVASEDDRT